MRDVVRIGDEVRGEQPRDQLKLQELVAVLPADLVECAQRVPS
ncbi:hypothetical protein AB0B10_25385 [Micromonospora arborensis]